MVQIPIEANALGTPITEYRRNILRLVLGLLVSGYITATGIVLLLVSLTDEIGLFFCSLPCTVLGLLWFVILIRERDLRVLVFPEGMSYTKQGKTQIIRWDDVAVVEQSITKVQYTFTNYLCTVQLDDGSKYTFDNALSNVEQLINTIQHESTLRITSRASEMYDAGHTIPFGKFSISKAGISSSKDTLPWDLVKSVTVAGGIITIKKRGKLFKWASATVAGTPNFFVFAHLVGLAAPGSSDLLLLSIRMKNFKKEPKPSPASLKVLPDVTESRSGPSAKAQQHLEHAYAYEERDKLEKALRECNFAIQLAPDWSEAHNLQGIVLEAVGRKEEALAAYREAVRLDPTCRETRRNFQELAAELG